MVFYSRKLRQGLESCLASRKEEKFSHHSIFRLNTIFRLKTNSVLVSVAQNCRRDRERVEIQAPKIKPQRFVCHRVESDSTDFPNGRSSF